MVSKKKFELAPDIVQIDVGSQNEQPVLPVPLKEPKVIKTYMNFHVDKRFKKEFQLWCVQRGLSQSDAIVYIFNKLQSLNEL